MSKKGRVFVVQRQMHWVAEPGNPSAGKLTPKHDLTPAEQFGEIVYLLSPTASPFNPQPLIADLHAKLFDFSPDDYVLLVGNPVLIGLTVAVAADYNDGSVKMLQWSGSSHSYRPVSVVDIFASDPGADILESEEDTDLYDETRYNR